jgi:hypothetical protein
VALALNLTEQVQTGRSRLVRHTDKDTCLSMSHAHRKEDLVSPRRLQIHS